MIGKKMSFVMMKHAIHWKYDTTIYSKIKSKHKDNLYPYKVYKHNFPYEEKLRPVPVQP